MNDREKLLDILRQLLNTDDGQLLVEELRQVWDNPYKSLIGETPEQTAYNVGKRDAYMTITKLAEKQP